MNNRILSLDIGDKYIGLAVSDPLGLMAQGLKTYKKKSRNEDLLFFKDLINKYNISKIVCGLPLNYDLTESSQSRKTQNYANYLKKQLGIEVVYVNEVLTTFEADEILKNSKKYKNNKKDIIDTLAAEIILQEYLDEQQNSN